MSNFEVKRIVVPTSFSKRSDAAVNRAADMACRLNAEIVLVHVVDPAQKRKEKLLHGQSTTELKQQANQRLIETARQISNAYGLNTRHKVYADTLYSGIYRSAVYYKANLIIMGQEHVRGLTDWLTGGNAERISIYSKVPVLSVSRLDTDEIKVILFPFNEDTRTLEKLEQVKTFAKLYNAVIHIAAFRSSERALTKSNIYLRTKRVAESVLKEGIWCSTHLLVGNDYGKEVLEFAKRLNADLISVVVYPMKGKRKFFSSPTFKKIVSRSNIPVLRIPVV